MTENEMMEETASPKMMSFSTAVKNCFKKYFSFRGCATRSEYWWFVLFVMAVQLVLFVPMQVVSRVYFRVHTMGALELMIACACLALLFNIAVMLPLLSVGVRRMHDTGNAGFLLFIPVANFVISLQPSEQTSAYRSGYNIHPVRNALGKAILLFVLASYVLYAGRLLSNAVLLSLDSVWNYAPHTSRDDSDSDWWDDDDDDDFLLYDDEEEDALFDAVDGKIKALLENEVVEATDTKLAALSDGAMRKRVARALGRAFAGDEMADALIDYIEVGNCRLVNVLHLNGGRLFVNFLVRSDWETEPKSEKSAEMLGRGLYQHHVFFLYDPAKKEITRIQYTRANYTPIAFHRHDYGGKSVLYAIANNSSFGMATTDVYLIALSAETLDLLFSECVLYEQAFYSNSVDDIQFCKDFAFEKNTAHFSGRDFDFDRWKYTDYEKRYTLP